MSTRRFDSIQLERYITALHEAGHMLVAHESKLWKVNDPAVTFPPSSTGHLARAHFGPREDGVLMTRDHAREYIKIGFAGLHSQNLIEEEQLLSVLRSCHQGCEEDLSEIMIKAKDAGIEDEVELLMDESLHIVERNVQNIHRLAEVINRATGDVPLADLLGILNHQTAPAPRNNKISVFSRFLAALVGFLKSLKNR